MKPILASLLFAFDFVLANERKLLCLCSSLNRKRNLSVLAHVLRIVVADAIGAVDTPEIPGISLVNLLQTLVKLVLAVEIALEVCAA